MRRTLLTKELIAVSPILAVFYRIVSHVSDLLWSDPDDSVPTWALSPRGCGFLFGSLVTAQFTHLNSLDLIARAHQLVEEGYQYKFNDK